MEMLVWILVGALSLILFIKLLKLGAKRLLRHLPIEVVYRLNGEIVLREKLTVAQLETDERIGGQDFTDWVQSQGVKIFFDELKERETPEGAQQFCPAVFKGQLGEFSMTFTLPKSLRR